MNTYKVVQDSKREEFRKYLEKNGVMDVLTRCLVSLYEEPEKPVDALQYVRNTLGAASPDKVELESLRLVVAEMKEKMTVLEEENAELRQKLSGLSTEEEGAAEEEGEAAEGEGTDPTAAGAADKSQDEKHSGKQDRAHADKDAKEKPDKK